MTLPALGVVIVSFNSTDVILDCLESLLAASGVQLHIVVVDNASTDGTPELLEAWAAGHHPWTRAPDLPFALAPAPKPLGIVPPDGLPPPPAPAITLLRAPVNGGFAAGVNLGLQQLARDPGIDRFWILNPDCLVPPQTPLAFATCDPGPFSLMGGRLAYSDPPDRIQIDGGTIDRRTGVTGNLNLGRSLAATPAPQATEMDFISGASMLASRAFLDRAGLLPEHYFLYYEEVDWALRRGDLPLAICPEALVYHRAGTAIGSPTLDRIASPFSLYFKHRARMRFVRRWFPHSVHVAWAYTLAKAAQYAFKGHPKASWAMLAGAMEARLPASIRVRLGSDASVRASAKADP